MFKYNLLLYLLSPFIFIKLLFYTIKNSTKLSYIHAKIFGKKISNSYSIWLHAASVGEIKIAINVAKCLINKGYDRVLITSNTPSSEYILQESNLKQIDHYYLPLDFFFCYQEVCGVYFYKIINNN